MSRSMAPATDPVGGIRPAKPVAHRVAGLMHSEYLIRTPRTMMILRPATDDRHRVLSTFDSPSQAVNICSG